MKSVDNAVNKAVDFLQSYTFIIGAVIIVGLLIVGFILYKFIPSFGGSSNMDDGDGDGNDNIDNTDNIDGNDNIDNTDNIENESDDINQKGGFSNDNIYLFSSLIVLFVYLYKKSIPLCGTLLILLILSLFYNK